MCCGLSLELGTGKPIIREAPSKGYFPFSFGKRSCIAGTLVLVEGTVILALLAQRATFHEVSRHLVAPCVDRCAKLAVVF